MTSLTFVTSKASSAQTVNIRKFFMEQKMMTIFISFQQKKKFWKSDQNCRSYNVVSRSGPPRPPPVPKRYSKTSHQIGLMTSFGWNYYEDNQNVEIIFPLSYLVWFWFQKFLLKMFWRNLLRKPPSSPINIE